MATIGLRIEPLDVLFFRDGRPFAGAERSVSTLPLPQTLAGALRTALLRQADCDFSALGRALQAGQTFAEAVTQSCGAEYQWIAAMTVRGPWLAREAKSGIEAFVPAPAILHCAKASPRSASGETAELYRLAPLRAGALPGWKCPYGLRPLWLKRHIATERATGFLTADGLRRFLAGQTPEPAQLIPASELFGMDYRVGIGVNGATQTVREGHTFGRGFLALRGGVFLYSEAEIPETAGGANCAAAEALGRLGVIPLGGEGRQALVTTIPPLAWPAATAANARGRGQILLLLTTPCPLREGWRPRALANHLAAAAVPEPIPFSGWDLARGGPRPTRFAVPAGSVYFLSASPEDLPKSLAEDEEEARQGWGCFLKGEWTDE